jgi:hypothetical protein
MNDIDHFKFFIFYIDDVTSDINHLYVKRIHLMSFTYIVIKDVSRPANSAQGSNKATAPRSSLHPQV